jgi:uncharacterized protein (DUF488 family)
VRTLADIRRYPASRRLPHFNAGALAEALPAAGIEYHHIEALGGRRSRRPDSPNGGWKVKGFQGYADHMSTEEFASGLERLEALARTAPTAIMCAEADWTHCHRRLTADALLARGWRVRHIARDGRISDHELTPFAVVDGTRIAYPPGQLRLG